MNNNPTKLEYLMKGVQFSKLDSIKSFDSAHKATCWKCGALLVQTSYVSHGQHKGFCDPCGQYRYFYLNPDWKEVIRTDD